jgi:hypothetical protein
MAVDVFTPLMTIQFFSVLLVTGVVPILPNLTTCGAVTLVL